MNEPRHLQVTLNRDGVAAPLLRAAILATNVVGTSLRALSNDDLSLPEMKADFMRLSFGELDLPEDERLRAYQNWILGKGFQDLARGVRETLEEAIFYIEMTKLEAGTTTWGALQSHMAKIRDRATRPGFPQLMEEVNAGLKERVAFEIEFLSLQKVRNCLEHRNGRVGAKDVDPINGIMALSFPRLKLTANEDGKETEIYEGQFFEKGAEVYLNRETRTREYVLEEAVVISSSDFYEIAVACHLFAVDLASKLPDLSTGNGGASSQ